MYFRANTQPHHFASGQSLNFNFDNSHSIDQEFMVQQQIQSAQLLSPTQHQRHDSLFGTSPSSTPKPGVSPQQHQAEPQPYVSTAQPTSQVVPHFPVNMSRSGSHYSTTSGQQAQPHLRQHRASYDSTARPGASDMSRSSTQLSGESVGYQYQAGPQPRTSQSMSDPNSIASVMARMPGVFPTNDSAYNSRSAYDFTLADALEVNTDIGNIGRLFGQETTSAE